MTLNDGAVRTEPEDSVVTKIIMQSSNPDAFDDFQVEFLEYLERRLGVERDVATAMLSHWLVHHSHRGGRGSRTVPAQEPQSSEAGATSADWLSRRR
jgi:hypothetical protein